MSNRLICIVLGAGFLCSNIVSADIGALDQNQKTATALAVHNRVLLKIDNDLVVTTLDVIHKLNLMFYTSYPHLVDSLEARSHFYKTMWPMVLEAVIDEFLMYADAKSKKINVDPTMVKQEIETMLGHDLMPLYTLFEMTEKDIYTLMHRMLVAQRASSMMVRSKVMLKVTPEIIKARYAEMVQESLNVSIWKYKILTIKAKTDFLSQQISNKVTSRVEDNQEIRQDRLLALVASLGGELTISEEVVRVDHELSDAHKGVLSSITLNNGMIGCASKHHKEGVYKVFVLLDKNHPEVKPLSEIEPQIKASLMQVHIEAIDKDYREKIRERFGFNPDVISQLLSESAPPLFSLL